MPAFGHIGHGFFGYQFFHRLAQFNDYQVVFLDVMMQPDFELPPYLRESGSLPSTVSHAILRVAAIKKHGAEFRMPIDS